MRLVSLKSEQAHEDVLPELRGGPGLDLDLLRTLVAIADTGSFNRAAQAVFRTPSAVSMQMKKLEDQIGRSLFAKEGRSVVLTPDGEMLVGYGRRISKIAEEALGRFRAPEIEGTIRLGTPDDYVGQFLPDILARFAASHPNVEVDVSCLPSGDLIARVGAGAIDIALVSSGYGRSQGKVVHREQLVWAGLRHGCAQESRPLRLALSHFDCCWRRMAIEALDRAGVEYRVAYSSRHYLGQLAPLMAGLALAPLPRSTVSGELKVFGEEAGLPPLGDLGIELRRSAFASTPLFDALANHIESNFRGYRAAAA